MTKGMRSDAFSIMMLDLNILAFDITQLAEPLLERGCERIGIGRRRRHTTLDKPDRGIFVELCCASADHETAKSMAQSLRQR